MDIQVGQQVKSIWTQRQSKLYTKFGSPAMQGEQGIVTRIEVFKEVLIVQFETNDGDLRFSHIQNLILVQ